MVFNLKTGTYQSVSRTAGLVLALIDRHGTVEDAADEIVRKTGRQPMDARSAFAAHCHELARAGLLEVDQRPVGPRPSGAPSRAA
jgi:hypothetical protein